MLTPQYKNWTKEAPHKKSTSKWQQAYEKVFHIMSYQKNAS